MTALQEQRAERVLAILVRNEDPATVAEIVEACGIPDHGVRRALSDLRYAGLAERVWGGRGSISGARWGATTKATTEAQEAAEASNG